MITDTSDNIAKNFMSYDLSRQINPDQKTRSRAMLATTGQSLYIRKVMKLQ